MHTFQATVTANPAPVSPERRREILAEPGFGKHFTDHMFLAEWTPDAGWADPRVVPYGPLQMDPATSVLHYAQEIFEGLKAYPWADGSLNLFRPEANARRLQQSARRLVLPELPVEWFVGSVRSLVETDRSWIPSALESSLYLRPFMFSSEAFIGMRATTHATFVVIASPVGPYFAGGVKPVSIWMTTEYSRAGAGGTGAAKCGGNYASSLLAFQEAAQHGCDQVAFLDPVERTYVEELGGMNMFFVQDDGQVVTPSLSGSILEGITRASVLQVAQDLGHDVAERRISFDEWRDGVASGAITEVFACGTAALVTPVGVLRWEGGEVGSTSGDIGPVTAAIRSRLLDIQYGRAEDPHGWMTKVC